MTIADRIRKMGFTRWAEQALRQSQARLLTAVLGIVVFACGAETLIRQRDSWLAAIGMVLIAFGIHLMVSGMRRHRYLLSLIASVSERATCRRCHAYAAFTLTAAGSAVAHPRAPSGEKVPQWFKVRCNHCDHQWTIEMFAGSLAA